MSDALYMELGRSKMKKKRGGGGGRMQWLVGYHLKVQKKYQNTAFFGVK